MQKDPMAMRAQLILNKTYANDFINSKICQMY